MEGLWGPVRGWLVITPLVLGLNWPVMSVAVAHITPLWLSAIRLLGAAVAVCVLQATTGRLRRVPPSDRPTLFSVGVLRLAMVYTLVFLALERVPPGRSAVLVYTSMVWAAPMAALLLSEPLRRVHMAVIPLALAGVALIAAPWRTEGSAALLWGYALLLLAALVQAGATVWIRGHRWSAATLDLLPWHLAVGGVVVAVVALAVEGAPRGTSDPAGVFAVGYQIVLAGVLGTWGTVAISRALPAATTTLLLLAAPLVGLVSSIMMTGERLTATVAAGAAAIALAVVAVVRDRRAMEASLRRDAA